LTRNVTGPEPHVALLLLGAGDLSGGGGAERQFADFFDHCSAHPDGRFRLSLLTDRYLFEQLRATGRLSGSGDIVILGGPSRRPPRLRTIRGIAYNLGLTARLLWALARNRYDMVHVCMLLPGHFSAMTLLRLLPRKFRPLITVMVIDCTFAHRLDSDAVLKHGTYFHFLRPDGVFTWYEKAREVIVRDLVRPSVPVRAARYCFANTTRFQPAATKQPQIVWAGRMDEQKDPLFFVEAVRIAFADSPGIFSRWTFRMFGKGPLEPAVRRKIAEAGLGERIEVSFAADLAPVFAASSIFVSTQSFENFTSLAMMEAMSAGNAIASRNVGQTGYFVRPGSNGLLLERDTPEGLAVVLADLCGNEARLTLMQN